MSALFYSVKDVEKILGVTNQAVHRMIASKEIEATKMGKAWFIPKDKFNAGLDLTPEQVEPVLA